MHRLIKLRAAYVLLAPAIIFIVVLLVLPIAGFLSRSIDNSDAARNLPQTISVMKAWDGVSPPTDAMILALHNDVVRAKEAQTLGLVGRHLNYRISGFRQWVNMLSRVPAGENDAATLTAILEKDDGWRNIDRWQVIQGETQWATSTFLLSAVDLDRTPDGGVQLKSLDTRQFLSVFGRTLAISSIVTAICLVVGYPVAYALTIARPVVARLLFLTVLIPFWTSLLIRTVAWGIILQDSGPINKLLLYLGLIDQTLPLLFNRFAVVLAMVYVLLPFMILPLYATMRAMDPSQMRAAYSLGAKPVRAFVRVYLPQTKHAISAGCLLTFILALGYYITPAVVGGPGDQMISYFIAFYANQTINWGLSAALSMGLLVIALILFAFYSRAANLKNMRMS